jgi:hypothetical protein
MAKLILILTLLLLTIIVSGQKPLNGIYRTNFPTYGMFGQTLTLKCDSSLVLNFIGDLMNDNSFGKWTRNKKILTLTFDSISYPNQRYKGQLTYRIKRNRFYLITFTKEQYQELKEKVEKYSKDNNTDLKLPGYKEFKKKYGRTMKNHSGKMRVQYMKRIKSTNCN